MTTIKMNVLRPTLIRGVPHPAGEVIAVTPAEAADLLATGRLELHDSRDAAAVRAAARDTLNSVMRLARHTVAETPMPASPWQAWPR